MRILDAINNRRSVKRFSAQAVTREQVEALLDAATRAPNHRLTQPWRFYVLGPEARYAYGLALGDRKARKLTDPEAARTLRETVGAEHRALPAMLAVAVVTTDNAEIAEEDYAATMMGVANLGLAAVAMGLGTAIRSGAVLNDPAARSAIGVGEDQRIVAIVNLGAPAEEAGPRPRTPAAALTTWVP